MICRILIALVCLFSFPVILSSQINKAPVPIIFDTDIGPDYDDVGAIALLHAFADSNECKILATIASNRYPRIAAVLDLFNTYFNRPDIPIGVVRKGGVDVGSIQKWDSIIVTRYPHSITSNDQAEDAVKLYRKILASQPDGSVTIVTVGFLTNLADLLQSPPDSYSTLDGKALVKIKVKQLVSMAARFDHEMGTFKEFNVVKDAAASMIVFEQWTTPIIFSGFEVGVKVLSGLPLINSSQIQNSPVKEVFQISIPKDPQDKNGRMSWDQTAVLIAVRGYEKYYDAVRGRIVANADGSNGWDPKGKGHLYVKERIPAQQVAELINSLMLHQPRKQ